MTDVSRVRWSAAQRLEFIEFRLLWSGRVNRIDIAEQFGVTVQQATTDLALYEKLAPLNIRYERSAKTFTADPRFAPILLRPHADRQLLQLAAIRSGWIEQEDTWFDDLPPSAAVPSPRRQVNAGVVRWMLEAIRDRRGLRVSYLSQSKKTPSERTIEPHALGFNGDRWHARAWCRTRAQFVDFTLARIEILGLDSEATVDLSLDFEWSREVTLILAPNPDLDRSLREVIARDYDMVRGRAEVTMRAALYFYFKIRHNLDLKLEPRRQHVVLLNAEAVEAEVEKAKAESAEAVAAAGQNLPVA